MLGGRLQARSADPPKSAGQHEERGNYRRNIKNANIRRIARGLHNVALREKVEERSEPRGCVRGEGQGGGGGCATPNRKFLAPRVPRDGLRCAAARKAFVEDVALRRPLTLRRNRRRSAIAPATGPRALPSRTLADPRGPSRGAGCNGSKVTRVPCVRRVTSVTGNARASLHDCVHATRVTQATPSP